MSQAATIVPRKGLDFGLDQPIPRYWLAGDVFRTRFFDATSTVFPEGERFFIGAVAKYRDRIIEPELRAQVQAFMTQEAQHGNQHEVLNRHLRDQGIDVVKLEAQSRRAFEFILRVVPERVTLAQTAAAEHVTALLATALFEQEAIMAGADARVRALFLWHAVEEIEHRAVAFDVMQRVARTPYALRVFVMLNVVLGFHVRVFYAMEKMFRADRIGLLARSRLWLGGLSWLFGPRGPYAPLLGRFMAYFAPNFHPLQEEAPLAQRRWVAAFERTRDPLQAAQHASHAHDVAGASAPA